MNTGSGVKTSSTPTGSGTHGDVLGLRSHLPSLLHGPHPCSPSRRTPEPRLTRQHTKESQPQDATCLYSPGERAEGQLALMGMMATFLVPARVTSALSCVSSMEQLLGLHTPGQTNEGRLRQVTAGRELSQEAARGVGSRVPRTRIKRMPAKRQPPNPQNPTLGR